MKKEIKFQISIEGKPHTILFAQKRTKYELYVDEQPVSHIIQTPYEENVEKDVRIDGKLCQFVLYGDHPDLVVDGILKWEEFRELKNQVFHKNVLLGLGLAQILIGTFCGIIWMAFRMAGMYSVGGVMGLVFSVAFTVAGVVEVLFGLRKMRALKGWKP